MGILGLSDSVRNGYRQIRVSFDIEGDASPEQLAALVEQSRRRSAVYDVLANGTDVVVDVTTPQPPDPTDWRGSHRSPAGHPSPRVVRRSANGQRESATGDPMSTPGW